MFTQEQLTTLRDSLPYDCAKRIKGKLKRVGAIAIANALKDPNTKRTDILKAAVEVAEEFKKEAEQISNRIEAIAS